MTIYGYARVSTREQNEDRQLIALHDVGVEAPRIYLDKQSGKDFERPQYRRLTRKMKKDDLLFIKSIDRLGRNYEEILREWRSGRISLKQAANACRLPTGIFYSKARYLKLLKTQITKIRKRMKKRTFSSTEK